jgi:hypothetical protein
LIASVIYVTVLLVRGISFLSAVKVAGIVAPFLLIIFLAYRRYWMGLAWGTMALTLNIPIAVLERLNLPILICAAVVVFTLAKEAIEKGQQRVLVGRGAKCIMFSGMLVLARFLWDRPGSARLGGSGGAGIAVVFVLAYFVFWAFSKLVVEGIDLGPNLRIVFIGGLLALAWRFFRAYPVMYEFRLGLFHRPFWIIAPFLLATAYMWRNRGKLKNDIFIYGVMAFLMGISVLSAHRSRPLFAIGVIGSVSYVYGRLKRAILAVAIIGVIGLTMLLIINKGGLPAGVKRSLSTIVPIAREEFAPIAKQYEMSSEVGWTSGFRAALFKIGTQKIRRNPFFGTGFSFTIEQLIAELYVLGLTAEDLLSSMALTGGYHNSLLALAVFCGLPAAILFACGYVLLTWGFVRRAVSYDDPLHRYFAACLLGFFVPSSGQMLMNGGSFDFLAICLALGMMNGMLIRPEREVVSEETIDSSRHVRQPFPFGQAEGKRLLSLPTTGGQ